MSDDLTVVGVDGIRRSFHKHYDEMDEVMRDPQGVFYAIQRQADRIEELEAKLAKAVEALKKIETGLPVGSSLFDGKNPLWRDAYRDLQRIARITIAELKGETS